MTNEECIKHLKEFLKIDTTGGNEKQTADYIEELLNQHGIKSTQVEYAKGRNQLIAVIEGTEKGKTLGFSGHMDVVPVGENQWQHPPFGAEETDGKIYARGSSDMKAGVIAAVLAAIQLKESNTPLKGNIKLLITIGEETGAIGAEQLTQEGYADDLDGLIIGEPSQNNICYAHKGAFWLKITTFGHTAHGSMPQQGINAIEHMLQLIAAFKNKFKFNTIKDEVLGTSTSSINVIRGGNGTNVVPDQCTIEMDIRTVNDQNHQHILQEVNNMISQLGKEIPHFKAEVEVINDQTPVYTDPKDPLLQISQESIKNITRRDPYVVGSPGYTDASQFVKAKKKYPILIIGPGGVDQAHQPDEHIAIKDFLDCIAIYKDITKKYLN